MASFFRWAIASKVLPFMKSNGIKPISPDVIASLVKVNRKSRSHPELQVPWSRVVKIVPDIENQITPPKFCTLLKNQGLPTAEGIIDIGLDETSTSLTFTVDKHIYSKIVLNDIYSNEEKTMKNSVFFCSKDSEKIVIYYNLPSIGKLLSVTDFRSIIHSNFIANINELVGNEVYKMFYMTDFNLKSALLMTGYEEFGIEKDFQKNPSYLHEILKVASMQYDNDWNFRSKVDICFKNMENGEDKVLSEWHCLRKMFLKQNEPLQKKLNLNFDDICFDSSFLSEIKGIYDSLVMKNIIYLENGKVKIDLSDDSSQKRSFNSDCTETFCHILCSVIHSVVKAKERYNFDIIYFIAPSSEKDFFSLIIKSIQKLGYNWSDKLKYIKLSDFQSVNSYRRKGLSIEDILDQAKLLMLEKLNNQLHLEVDENLEEVASELSYASVHMFDMKHKRSSEYLFDLNKMLHFGKDSGAAFQLCHAGLKGLQEDSEFIFNKDIDTSPLLEKEAHKLILHLSRFDEIIYYSYLYLEPYIIYQYLTSLWYLTDQASKALKLDIKSDRLVVIKARLFLFSATLTILQKCLKLLGLTPYVNKDCKQNFF